MQKKIMTILAVSILFFAATEVSAQDVVMNSAETINQGNLKLGVYPTVLFGKNGGDSRWGVAGRFGYGFTPSFDIEAKAAFFKDLTYLGFDAEYWFVKGRDLYASGIVGWHMTNVAVDGDSSGFDLALLVGTRPHDPAGVVWGIQGRLRFAQEFGLQLQPAVSRARDAYRVSAPTSTCWRNSASASTTMPATTPASAWHSTF